MTSDGNQLTDFLIRSNDLPWVPQGSGNVWFKPLRISTERDSWVNILRVDRGGVVNRHRHLAEVEGWVLQGHWHYREHDWQAEPGAYVYEPPGDVHTLVADLEPGSEPMLTLFFIHGPIEYMDANGELAYIETAETKLRRYHDFCAGNGLEPQQLDF